MMPNIPVEAMEGVTQVMAVAVILAMAVAVILAMAVVVAILVMVVATLVMVAATLAVVVDTVGMAVAVAGHTTEVAEGAAITLAKLLLHKLKIRLTIKTMQFYLISTFDILIS